MPEKGWYSISVREKTAKTIRENAKTKKMTIDAYLNNLMTVNQASVKKTGFVICEICRVKVKQKNLQRHIARNHPEQLFK